MNKPANLDKKPDPGLQKFDNLYGTLKKLTKTERDIKRLKLFIGAIEKKACKYRNLPGERCMSYKRRKRSSNVIPKVHRKYISSCQVPKEAILSNKNKCPKWLILLAEGCTAIFDCYWEVREELRIICNKFGKQESYYLSMCDRRYIGLPDNYVLDLEKAGNTLNSRFNEKYDKLTLKICEHLQQLEERKEKGEKLLNINLQIQNELERIMERFSDVCPALQVESMYNESVDSKIQEYLSSTLEKTNFIQSLNQELDERAKSIDEIRSSNRLSMSLMGETLQDLQFSYSKVVEEKEAIERKTTEMRETINKLKKTVITVKSRKKNILHVLCKREEEMDNLLQDLKSLKELSPDTLDKKKRLQEVQQGILADRRARKEQFKQELESKNKEFENINRVILEEKTNFIVPLKLQINEYKERTQKSLDECRAAQENNLMLKKKGYILTDEHSDLIFLQRKIKILLANTQCILRKRQHLLNILPRSLGSQRSQYTATSTELSPMQSSSLLSQTKNDSMSLPNKQLLQLAVAHRECKELEEDIRSNVVHAGRAESKIVAKLDELAEMQKHESVLRRAVSQSRIQVDPLQETTMLVTLVFLTKVAELSMDPCFHNGDVGNSLKVFVHLGKISAMHRKSISSGKMSGVADSFPSLKLSKAVPGEYVSKATRELHAQFSKLLFL